MTSGTLANAADLNLWSDRREAQSLLPELVRRLVHGSTRDVIRSGFRSGEGVSLGGWDGIIEVRGGNAFVPDGPSAWELSVEKKVKSKADADYAQRTAKPGDANPSESTFVFVTPRRWAGRDRWVAARLAEKTWHDVRAYDADSLAEWLESAPGVHLWLSILLGKQPEGAVDAETFWKDWSSATQPPVTPDLVFSGRSGAEQAIQTWIQQHVSTAALQCESRDEAAAVFVGALLRLPPEQGMAGLARTVVVRDPGAWHRLAASNSGLILVPTFDVGDAIARAVRSRNRVVVALGRADSAADGTIVVPRVRRDDAMKALVATGVPEERARELASLARRSFLSFRRKLAQRPEVQQPAWARPQEAPDLLPALLSGAWDDAMQGDREAVRDLSQASFETVNATVARWSQEDDPPVRHIGDAWYLVSKEDAWSLLSRFLTLVHIERFNAVVLEVLGVPDPQFSLPDEKRWMAGALGHGPKHSEILCEGLADTLAIMGARGDSVSLGTGRTARDYAAKIVRELLERANADWRVWASISEWGTLPLLAEASPRVFLDAVEEGLRGSKPILREMFREEEGNTIFGRSPHTGLLWALETLAWNPDYLPRVAMVLAKLAKLDPGGNVSNRPKNSLRNIFLLWYPQTAATFDQRLSVLDTLREQEPDVTWQLLNALLPIGHDSASNNPAPRWRDWKGDAGGFAPHSEAYKGAPLIVERMIDDVGTRGTRWQDLIEHLGTLPPELHESLVNRLKEIDPAQIDKGDRATIWNALRTTISHHRSFSGAEWAIPEDRLAQLARLYERFTPTERTARYAWLFSNSPTLLEGREGDWTALEKAVVDAQTMAVREVHAEAGLSAVLDLIPHVEMPGALGLGLARTGLADPEEDSILHDHLAAAGYSRAQFGRGFAFGRIQIDGQEWAQRKVREESNHLSPSQRGEILSCLPSNEECWDLATACGQETERQYWQRVGPYGIAPASVERAASMLIQHGRPHVAVTILAAQSHHIRFSRELIAEALEMALLTAPENDAALNGFAHHATYLFEQFGDGKGLNESRIAKLEWGYLPLLTRGEGRKSPRFLHRELARNPDFFADIVALVYRAEGEKARDLSQQQRLQAQHGFHLLNSFRTVPGLADDAAIDGDYLKNWIARARKILNENGRDAIGDQMIGMVLSAAPQGHDYLWPEASVRDAIERIASRHLEKGFELGIRNSRGVTARSPYDGGQQERDLATKYDEFAQAMSEKWPRTSAMLRRIAEAYRADARREDDDAEQGEDLEG